MTRLIKRRTLAQELCENGQVRIGDRVAKSSTTIKTGDRLSIQFERKVVEVVVLMIPEKPIRKTEATKYYAEVNGHG